MTKQKLLSDPQNSKIDFDTLKKNHSNTNQHNRIQLARSKTCDDAVHFIRNAISALENKSDNTHPQHFS